jgi:hypothetical protein
MAVDERRRHRLFRRLEEVLGPDEAGTLMEHLPPMGWGDVARKSDIETLRLELKGELESRLNSQTKTLVTLMSAQVVAVAGLAFAAARLA